MLPPGHPDFEPPLGPALARPLTRVGATIVDSLVFIPIGAIVFNRSGLSGSSSTVPASVYSRSLLILLGVELVYQMVLIGLLGQTVGDLVVGIKVVRQSSLAVPGFVRAVQRVATIAVASLVPVVGSLIVLLCYLWMFWDPYRQGLHDKVARTLVVDLRPQRQARYGRPPRYAPPGPL